MPYRLSLVIDKNATLHVEHETLQEVCDDYDRLGGDSDWLMNAGRTAVTASRHGEAAAVVARTLGGEVIDESFAVEQETTDPFLSENAVTLEESRKDEAVSAPEGNPNADPFGPDDAVTPPVSTAPTAATSVSGQRSAIVNGSRIAPPSDPWNTTPEIEDPHPDGCRCTPCQDQVWPGEATVAREALTTRKPANDDPWGAEAAAAQPVDPAKPVVKHDNYGRQWTLNLLEAPDCKCNEKAAKIKGRAKQTQRLYEGWTCARGMSDNWKNKCDHWQKIS